MRRYFLRTIAVGILCACACDRGNAQQTNEPASVAVGAQYDSTHVYVAHSDFDAFVNSFVATFGGKPSRRSVTSVLPVPSSTEFQYVWSDFGTLSVFAYQTPIPFPFGDERTGYLVTDMDQAIRAARAAGAVLPRATSPHAPPRGRHPRRNAKRVSCSFRSGSWLGTERA